MPEVLGPNLGKKVSYLKFKDIDAGEKIFYGLPIGFYEDHEQKDHSWVE